MHKARNHILVPSLANSKPDSIQGAGINVLNRKLISSKNYNIYRSAASGPRNAGHPNINFDYSAPSNNWTITDVPK
jgi:hypothetical protein